MPKRSRTPINTDAPAIKALLQIGPDATPELLHALARLPYDPREFKMERLAIVITLANLNDTRTRPALEDAARHAGYEKEVAKEALHQMDKKR